MIRGRGTRPGPDAFRTRPGGSLLLIGLAVVLGSLKADDELTVLLLFGGYALTWGLFLLRRRRNS